jgi:hypothetical protein
VGDDISSDAIIYAAPVAAGPTHERDPAPAREEESGGAESAVASFDVADPFADNRSVAGLLLESCEAPVDSFGSATVRSPFGICQRFFQTAWQLRVRVSSRRQRAHETFVARSSSFTLRA